MKTRFAAPRWLCLALMATLLLGPWSFRSSVSADEHPTLPQWQKDSMRCKGKTFVDCKFALLHEIDAKERLENLKPMAIFARHGMEEEVVTAILHLMREYDHGFLSLDEEIEAKAVGEALRSEEEKNEDAIFDECAKIVKKIGPAAALPTLRQWLSGEYRGACFFALMVLSEGFGPAAREAVPDIWKLTKDEDYRIAADAYMSLSQIEKNDTKLLEYLKPGLQHKNGEVRATVLDAIARTGNACVKSAAADILKALEDSDGRVAEAAAWAALQAELGPRALPAMIKLIQRDDADAQNAAYLYLRLLGPAAKDAVPALIDILKKAHDAAKTHQFVVVYRQKSDVPAPAPEPVPLPEKKIKMPGSFGRRVLIEINPLPQIDPLPQPLPPPPGKKMPMPSVPVPSDIGPGTMKMMSVPVPMRSDPPVPPPAKEPMWSRADLGDEVPLGRQKLGSVDYVREKMPFDEFAEAIGALEAIGPEAREAVPVLRELLKTASSKHKHLIRGALMVLERRPADAAPDSNPPAPVAPHSTRSDDVPLPPAEKDAVAPESTRPAVVPAPVPLPAKKAPKSTRPANVSAQRTTEVYHLKQALAPDLAITLQTYITNEMSVLASQPSPYLQNLCNVVVTPEPISNTLILGGSPQELEVIKTLIRAIDEKLRAVVPAPPAKVTTCAPAEWSAWGQLRRAGFEKDGQTVYVLEDSKKQPLVYAIEKANSTARLEKLLGQRVCLYGPTQYCSDEFPRLLYLVATNSKTDGQESFSSGSSLPDGR